MATFDEIRALLGKPPESSLSLEERENVDRLRAAFRGKPEPIPMAGKVPDSWFPHRKVQKAPSRVLAEFPVATGDPAADARRRLRAMLNLPPEVAAERREPGSPSADDLARSAGIRVDRSGPVAPTASEKLRQMFATLPPATRQDLAQMLSRGTKSPGRLMADRATAPESPTARPRVLTAGEAPSPADLGLTAGEQS